VKAYQSTIGFGCPDVIDPHHFIVTIPKNRGEMVTIAENFGIETKKGHIEIVARVLLQKSHWNAIADILKFHFNERLKAKDLKTAQWVFGENKVERILGRELCVIAWAIECAGKESIPVAIKHWLGLKPEERWWLFSMTASATGLAQQKEIGWRKALRFALTENPTVPSNYLASNDEKKRPRNKKEIDDTTYTLF